MIDDTCRFVGDRDATLVAYLYGEIDPGERGIFEAHLDSCSRCRTDLSALGGVREALARWAPPEPTFAGTSLTTFPPGTPVQGPSVVQPARRTLWKELGDIPAWAQVAAAMLFLGVAGGVANLDVRYDAQGLTVRTGWSRSPAVGNAGGAQTDRPVGGAMIDAANKRGGAAPWRSDLAALEQQLRQELRPSQLTSGAMPVVPAGSARWSKSPAADAELMRRVRALVDESEKRQQRELALRVAEVVRDVGDQRRADLRRIDLSLNGVQNSLGVEVLKQRQSLNYLLQVSQRP